MPLVDPSHLAREVSAAEIQVLYVTAPSIAVAQDMATTMVKAKLAACANILPGMTSIYAWQGRIETADEVVVIFKTRADLARTLREAIVKAHPYDTPCVVALDVVDGHRPFLDWIVTETTP